MMGWFADLKDSSTWMTLCFVQVYHVIDVLSIKKHVTGARMFYDASKRSPVFPQNILLDDRREELKTLVA